MQVEIGGSSNRGAASPVNEDALYYPAGPGAAVTPTQLAAHGKLLAVADGHGGTAATLVIQELVNQYYAQVGANAAENLRRAIHETNARVLEHLKESQGLQAGTGSTMVAAVLKNELLYVANVGTCRAYLIRAHQCWPLTRDHLGEDGSPSRRLALSPYLDPDIYLPLSLEVGDRLVLCSNGLSEFLPVEDEWVSMTGRGNPEAVADNLIAQARTAGSQEDASAIIALMKADRPERRVSGGQLVVLILLGLLALFLLIWFLLELWWTFT